MAQVTSPTVTIPNGVKVKYVGGSIGVGTWQAPSKKMYQVGALSPYFEAMPQDVEWLIGIRVRGKVLFELVVEPTPVVAPTEPVVEFSVKEDSSEQIELDVPDELIGSEDAALSVEHKEQKRKRR